MLLVLYINLNLKTLTDINTIATGSKMDGKGSAAVTRTSQQTVHPVPVQAGSGQEGRHRRARRLLVLDRLVASRNRRREGKNWPATKSAGRQIRNEDDSTAEGKRGFPPSRTPGAPRKEGTRHASHDEWKYSQPVQAMLPLFHTGDSNQCSTSIRSSPAI